MHATFKHHEFYLIFSHRHPLYTYMHTYIHTYIRTYIHTYIHTYLHTHTGATARSLAHYGNGSGLIHLNNVNCWGSENRLVDCPYSNDVSDCTHSEDAGVDCQCKCCTNQNSMACIWCRLAECCLASYYCTCHQLSASDSLTEHFLFMCILVTQMLKSKWSVGHHKLLTKLITRSLEISSHTQ